MNIVSVSSHAKNLCVATNDDLYLRVALVIATLICVGGALYSQYNQLSAKYFISFSSLSALPLLFLALSFLSKKSKQVSPCVEVWQLKAFKCKEEAIDHLLPFFEKVKDQPDEFEKLARFVLKNLSMTLEENFKVLEKMPWPKEIFVQLPKSIAEQIDSTFVKISDSFYQAGPKEMAVKTVEVHLQHIFGENLGTNSERVSPILILGISLGIRNVIESLKNRGAFGVKLVFIPPKGFRMPRELAFSFVEHLHSLNLIGLSLNCSVAEGDQIKKLVALAKSNSYLMDLETELLPEQYQPAFTKLLSKNREKAIQAFYQKTRESTQ